MGHRTTGTGSLYTAIFQRAIFQHCDISTGSCAILQHCALSSNALTCALPTMVMPLSDDDPGTPNLLAKSVPAKISGLKISGRSPWT